VQGQQDLRRQRRRARRFSGRVRTGEGRQLRRRHRAHLSALLSGDEPIGGPSAPRPWSVALAVRVIDTKAVSMAQGLLVIDVAELAATAPTSDQLVAHAESLVARSASSRCSTRSNTSSRADASEVLALCSDRSLDQAVARIERRCRRRGRTSANSLQGIGGDRRGRQVPRAAQTPGARSRRVERGRALEALVPTSTRRTRSSSRHGSVVGAHGGPGIIGLCWIEV